MLLRQASLMILISALAVCCSVNQAELYRNLPEKDKELYDRSMQFMTDNQQERYLLLHDSAARAEMIAELHIADRLAKFPGYVRDAIMAQRIFPGMGFESVILSWGKPEEIDRRDVDGVPTECWFYSRADGNRIVTKKVFFLRGLVTEVSP